MQIISFFYQLSSVLHKILCRYGFYIAQSFVLFVEPPPPTSLVPLPTGAESPPPPPVAKAMGVPNAYPQNFAILRGPAGQNKKTPENRAFLSV